MLRTRFFFGLSVLFLAGGIVVTAQGRGNAPKPTHTTTPKAAPAPHSTPKTSAPKSAKTTQPPVKAQHTPPSTGKTQAAKTTTMKTAGSTTQSKSAAAKTQKVDKSTSKVAAKSTTKPATSDKADTKVAKAEKPAKTTKSAKASSTSTSTTTGGSTTGTTTELTAVQQKLKQNTNLAAKVSSRLPEGTDLMAAAAGFKNLGQFVAAANVSHNLQLSFTELKAKMMTGMSLGQAIQAVRPLTASPTIEAQRAEYDARGLIAETEQSASAPATTLGTTPTTTSTSTTSTTSKSKVRTKNRAQ